MIKEAYCSYEIYKLLKEKGFKIITHMVYDNQGNLDYQYCVCCNIDRMPCLYAPTHQMTMAWLREVHKILIVIDAYHADHWDGYIDSFKISIYWHASTIIVPNEIAHHTDYTEAVEAAIKYSLEKLI